MIEVQEMSNEEIEEILQRVGYGHLACARNSRPYVVPINYVYVKPYIYLYTTEGLKTEIISGNPQVCLQVEEVVDNTDWRSIVVNGEAEHVVDRNEREDVLKQILSTNPTLTPAISIRWMDNWVRENREVIYRIKPEIMAGRSAVKVKISAAFVQPGTATKSQIN
jgi:nitroimidazol reductase NimA-like FMN-containing flavoprotein (pyridoxamine 5'-phosphate oxidase superfamily)